MAKGLILCFDLIRAFFSCRTQVIFVLDNWSRLYWVEMSCQFGNSLPRPVYAPVLYGTIINLCSFIGWKDFCLRCTSNKYHKYIHICESHNDAEWFRCICCSCPPPPPPVLSSPYCLRAHCISSSMTKALLRWNRISNWIAKDQE